MRQLGSECVGLRGPSAAGDPRRRFRESMPAGRRGKMGTEPTPKSCTRPSATSTSHTPWRPRRRWRHHRPPAVTGEVFRRISARRPLACSRRSRTDNAWQRERQPPKFTSFVLGHGRDSDNGAAGVKPRRARRDKKPSCCRDASCRRAHSRGDRTDDQGGSLPLLRWQTE